MEIEKLSPVGEQTATKGCSFVSLNDVHASVRHFRFNYGRAARQVFVANRF
jgi:hypothetical protein